jgi:hypothetical protein
LRKRKDIEEGWEGDIRKVLEVLLDIRELLKPPRKRGRPKKVKNA